MSENEKLVKETKVTVQEAKKFADIVPNHWAKYDISWIVQKGYASGMDSNAYASDKGLSRAEAAKLTGVTNDGQNGNGFSDVPSNHWASKEIATMKRLGYMEGVEDGTFNPSGVVTREQLAQLLTNILKLKAKDASNGGFSDVLLSDWSSSAIQLVNSNGIMEGLGDGTFHPKEPLTRGQMATVIRNTADFWK